MATSLQRCLLFGTFVLCSFLLGRWTGPSRAEQAAADPLLEVNKTFRRTYARTRQVLLDRQGPIICAEFDDLVLLHKGKRTVVTYIPESYHSLKSVGHMALALYAILLPQPEGALPDQLLTELESFRKQIALADKALAEKGLPKDTVARLQPVLGESTKLLDHVLGEKALAPGAVRAFARKVGPALLEVSADAARAQIDALHRQVLTWKATMTAEEWQRLHVIILGGQMPRAGNLATQYFARLLREPGEGTRIIYAEGLGDEEKALRLLGTHLLDTEIGGDFFLDRRRMHRDLLADAAHDYLEKMNFDAAKP